MGFILRRYGDKTPRSLIGRLFGVLWILLGLIVITMFTATVTSALTLSSSPQFSNSLEGQDVSVQLDYEIVSDAPSQFYTQFLSNDMYRSMPSLKVLTKRLKTIENNKTVITQKCSQSLTGGCRLREVWNCEDSTGKCMVFWISDAYER